MASENIIIEISADASKLTPVIDQLVKLGQVSAKDAEEFKKIAAAAQTVTTETLKTTEAVKQSAAATTQASAIKEAAIQKEIARLKELETLSKKAADPASAQKFATAIKESETRIKSLNSELNKTPKPLKDSGIAAQSLRSQLREAKEEVNRLSDASGGRLTPELLKAAQNAAKIDDKIKDLNATLNALNPEAKLTAFLQVGTGISGAFTAAQGAMALFGNESEDVQKALLKVQAALAITQGLNSLLQIGDAFKNLKAVLGIVSVAQNTLAASTSLAAGAQVGQEVATKGATIAQRALNVAMNSNPIVILIASLGALVAAYLLLSRSQEENIKLSAEEIEKNNNQIESLRALRGEVTRLQLEIDKVKGKKTELEFNLAINKQQFDEDLAKIQGDIVEASNKIREVVEKELPQVNADELARSLRARNAQDELGMQQKNDAEIQKEVKKASAARIEEIRKRFTQLAKESEFGLTALQEQETILREKFDKQNKLAEANAEKEAADKKKKEKVVDVDKKDFDIALSLLGQYFREKQILTLLSGQDAIKINNETFNNEVQNLNDLIELYEKFGKDTSQLRLELEQKIFERQKKNQTELAANIEKIQGDLRKRNKDVLDGLEKDEKESNTKRLKEQEEFERTRNEIVREFAQLGADLFFDSINNQFEANIQALEDTRDAQQEAYDGDLKDLEELNKNKIISDGKYAQEKKRLEKEKADAEIAANKKIAAEKLRQFNFQRIADLARVAIATATNIIEQPGPYGALIPYWAALGALQAGIILAQPVPKFKKGVLDLQGAGTGESDSIPTMLSRGESVMTAKETKMFMPTLSAIRKNLIPAEVMNKFVVEGKGGRVEAYIDTNLLNRANKKILPQQADLIGRSVAKYINRNSHWDSIRGEYVN